MPFLHDGVEPFSFLHALEASQLHRHRCDADQYRLIERRQLGIGQGTLADQLRLHVDSLALFLHGRAQIADVGAAVEHVAPRQTSAASAHEVHLEKHGRGKILEVGRKTVQNYSIATPEALTTAGSVDTSRRRAYGLAAGSADSGASNQSAADNDTTGSQATEQACLGGFRVCSAKSDQCPAVIQAGRILAAKISWRPSGVIYGDRASVKKGASFTLPQALGRFYRFPLTLQLGPKFFFRRQAVHRHILRLVDDPYLHQLMTVDQQPNPLLEVALQSRQPISQLHRQRLYETAVDIEPTKVRCRLIVFTQICRRGTPCVIDRAAA